ncbi:MAG: tyrosine-type recombinase/integrase [Anaerolineaceae bacterium]
MATNRTSETPGVAPDVLTVYRDAFLRSLSAENKSPRTRQSYGEAVNLMAAFLRTHALPAAPELITREHLTAWINDMLATWKSATAANRYRGASRFFAYLVEAGELKESPMARMKPPKTEEMEVPIIRDVDLQRLLKSCEGKDFRDRRDFALVLAFLDTGLRVNEMASLKLQPDFDTDSWVDVDDGVFWVVGKGRRQRRVPLGNKARKALDHYLFVRTRHAYASEKSFWIGERGRIGPSGLYQIIERRCELAGIPRIHPHQFRHTFAHKLQAANINDSDLMYLAGWKSREMLNRYGASAAAERAIDAHRRPSPADRL